LIDVKPNGRRDHPPTAYAAGKFLGFRITGPREGVDGSILEKSDLRDDVRRRAEPLNLEGPARARNA
jgi:hypothetical protein